MRVRGTKFEVLCTGAEKGLPFFWGHSLMGSIAQEDEAGVLPWSGVGDDVRLIRWDARGHGRSEAAHSAEEQRWPELAADLFAIADSLGIERAVLGGVSMGAATALQAAEMRPDRVLGLVLMTPPTAWESRPKQALLYRSAAKMVEWLGLGFFRFGGEVASLTTVNRGLAAMKRSVARGVRGRDPRTLITALEGAALSDLPSLDRLAELEIPTLILAWTRDPHHPIATAEALADRMPKATLQVATNLEEIRSWPARVASFLDGLAESEATPQP